jgi:hypothetical protein
MNKERLLKLADHLETNFGHDKFDFHVVTEGARKANGCGTLGCAYGELPIAFPNVYRFVENPYYDWGVDGPTAYHFFEIGHMAYGAIFEPDAEEERDDLGCPFLAPTEPTHVAANIRHIVATGETLS